LQGGGKISNLNKGAYTFLGIDMTWRKAQLYSGKK
jgi:hypothetical protein